MWDRHKAIAVTRYVFRELDTTNDDVALGAIYLADKRHLSRYGRTITGDTYRVGRRSVVPEECSWIVYGDTAPFDREIDMTEFSESDRECLDEVLAECLGKTADELDALFQDGLFHNGWRFNSFRIGVGIIAFMLPNAQAVTKLLSDEERLRAAELEALVEENRNDWDERDAALQAIQDTF